MYACVIVGNLTLHLVLLKRKYKYERTAAQLSLWCAESAEICWEFEEFGVGETGMRFTTRMCTTNRDNSALWTTFNGTKNGVKTIYQAEQTKNIKHQTTKIRTGVHLSTLLTKGNETQYRNK